MENFSKNIIRLSSVDSTNNYLSKLISTTNVASGTVILAQNQTEGKGQRGNSWLTEPNKNLIVSIFFNHINLSPDVHFLISMAVTNAIHKTLSKHTDNVKIKWPNDILINNKKVGGVLIENAIQGTTIKHSIIGIGINVNQENFNSLPNASSLINFTGEEVSPEEILKDIYYHLSMVITDLNKYMKSEKNYYLGNLFGCNHVFSFLNQQKALKKGTIKDVGFDGKLSISQDDTVKTYYFKEIEFLLSE